MAPKAYHLAEKNGRSRVVFVSKMDLENANFYKILEELKSKFGPSVCPCVVPFRTPDGTVLYINLFSQKAFKYEGGKQVQVAMPDMAHRLDGLVEAMSEAVAETDDADGEVFLGRALYHRGDRAGAGQGLQERHDHPGVLRQRREPAGAGYAAV